jgi:phosphate transport system permease protein
MTLNYFSSQKREDFQAALQRRNLIGLIWERLFFVANVFSLVILAAVAFNVANGALGYVVFNYDVLPEQLSERPINELSEPELVDLLVQKVPRRLRVILRDNLSQVPNNEFTQAPLSRVLAGKVYAPEKADLTVNDLTEEQIALILSDNLTQEEFATIIRRQIIKPNIVQSWGLWDSLTNRAEIERIAAEKYPKGDLEFYSWVSWEFVTSSVSSNATTAGLRTALLGTMWIMLVVILASFPVGLAAAIYLQEYADQNSRFTKLIETNIRNLAGVPSIIYGMLGLAVFARTFEFYTSGRFVGFTDTNGRTVVSAGLTLALLILPTIIINAKEALKAVPSSLREASYGMGATKWQTVTGVVLPNAIGGILTGIILAVSRAIGETAPLIVVGASTFIGIDPNGPFSKFTVVPIQIYQWTSRPELEFKNAAAAAIIVLVSVLLLLNSTAIYLRNRYSMRI